MIAQYPVFLPKWKFCQYQLKTIEKQKLNFPRSALFHMETRVSLKYFVNGSRCIFRIFNLNLSQLTPATVIWYHICSFQQSFSKHFITQYYATCLRFKKSNANKITIPVHCQFYPYNYPTFSGNIEIWSVFSEKEAQVFDISTYMIWVRFGTHSTLGFRTPEDHIKHLWWNFLGKFSQKKLLKSIFWIRFWKNFWKKMMFYCNLVY